ncbi:hypothetical protein [Empedobacter stercoris]|uniref:Uncharacterized protein n=1 Tax=Empedobacter stercoris TaxID=1628248 RepID=A0ABX1WKW3_9FLAO|nr:hypothetical protein [Empedobacter stercoris]NOJ75322.1 hypothetical protein [Empedobacter stercoris]
MKLIFPFIFIILIFSCKTNNIHYNRDKILKKYSKEYSIFINNEITDFEKNYLDRDNIENITINKKSKKLNITLKKINKLFKLSDINIDNRRGWDKKKIDLIIIDDRSISDSLKNFIKIDPNAIKSINIVPQNKMNNQAFGKQFNGDLLIITTK